jgi:hypothetical protein
VPVFIVSAWKYQDEANPMRGGEISLQVAMITIDSIATCRSTLMIARELSSRRDPVHAALDESSPAADPVSAFPRTRRST